MLISNGSILNEKCGNIALARRNYYEDNCGVVPQQSNGSVFIDNCVALTDWTNSSAGDGVASAVVYLTEKTFKLDSGSIGSGNNAWLTQDVGTFGDRVVATIKLNSSLLGAKGDNDHMAFVLERAGVQLLAGVASDGLFIFDGVAWNEVGTDLVSQNTDQTWTFDCDFSTPASATCDVYLNGVLKVSGVDCSYTGSFTEGKITLAQFGYTLANCITYVDSIEIGDDLVTDSIDTWEDLDNGTNAESSQVVFQGDSCFKFDSGDQSGSNYAYREKVIGSFEDSVVFSVSLHHKALGAIGDDDCFIISVRRIGINFAIKFATDGLFIHDGSVYNEVGTNLVQTGVDQDWTFDCDFSTPASATCDVYLNGVLQASSVDCSLTGTFVEGYIFLRQVGYTTANRITYAKDIRIGDDFFWHITQASNGQATQDTFDGKSCFKLEGNTSGTGNGYVSCSPPLKPIGDIVVVGVELYHDLIGTTAANREFRLDIVRSDVRCTLAFCSDGLFSHTGAAWSEVSTDIVVQDVWQRWVFVIDFTTPASATVDVYLDDDLIVNEHDCSWVVAGTNNILLQQWCYGTSGYLTYVNNFIYGDSLVGMIADKETYYDDCSSLTGWTDLSAGTGSVTVTTFSGVDAFKVTNGASAGASNYGYILRDVGDFDNITTATMEVCFETLGTFANNDRFILQIIRAGVRCITSFASDGVYVYDGSAHNLVVSGLTQEALGEWTFVIDFTTPASATVDIYLDNVLLVAGADCSSTGTFTEGEIKLLHYGDTTANCITYVTDLRIGTELLGGRVAYEYLPDYTETDPNSHIAIDPYKVTVSGLPRNEDAYIYKDFGHAYFIGDLEFLLSCRMTGFSNNGENSVLSMANVVDDWQGVKEANSPQISIKMQYDTDTYKIQLVECYNGSTYSSTLDCIEDTTYYIKFVRSEQESSYGVAYCFVYIDEDMTLLSGTLEVDLHEKTDYRFLYSTQSINSGDAYSISGWSSNIELVSFDFSDGEQSWIQFTFSNQIPVNQAVSYGLTTVLQLTTTITGSDSPYVYDVTFYNGYNDVQIGSTVSGIESGNYASTAIPTTSGGEYKWYLTATSSGEEDTSDVYSFTNKFLCAGDVKVDNVLTSGIYVRLYRRSTGVLAGEEISTTSGTFQIETDYNEEHYCVALGPDEYTNALIYDRLIVT